MIKQVKHAHTQYKYIITKSKNTYAPSKIDVVYNTNNKNNTKTHKKKANTKKQIKNLTQNYTSTNKDNKQNMGPLQNNTKHKNNNTR